MRLFLVLRVGPEGLNGLLSVLVPLLLCTCASFPSLVRRGRGSLGEAGVLFIFVFWSWFRFSPLCMYLMVECFSQ